MESFMTTLSTGFSRTDGRRFAYSLGLPHPHHLLSFPFPPLPFSPPPFSLLCRCRVSMAMELTTGLATELATEPAATEVSSSSMRGHGGSFGLVENDYHNREFYN